MIDYTDPYQVEPTPDQIRRRINDEGLADHQRYANVWEAILSEVWEDEPVRYCSELDENDPQATR